MKLGVSVILAILLCLSAIPINSEEQDAKWLGTMAEENGIKVINNPEKPLYGTIELELELELVIGNEGDDNYLFNKLIYPAVDSYGNIFVLDQLNNRLQKFDKHGNFIISIGRPGQGPGEFYNPHAIQLDIQNNIYLYSLLKIHIFNNEGKFQRIFHINRHLHDFMVTPNQSIIGYYVRRPIVNGEMQRLTSLELIDTEGEVLKTIASYPFNAPDITRVYANQAVKFQSPQFCFCPMNNGLSVYGFPSEYKMYVLDSSGECSLIIRKEASPVKIVSSEKKEAIEEMEENIERVIKDPNIKAKFPKYKPYYDKLLCDDNNNIYVRKATKYKKEENIILYDLFSQEGYYLYEIKLSKYLGRVWAIKNGYVYSQIDGREAEYYTVLRYKIRNWDAIKSSVN